MLNLLKDPSIETFLLQASSIEGPQTPTSWQSSSSFENVYKSNHRLNNIVACSLIDCSFPNTVPNVRTGQCDKITYTFSDSRTVIRTLTMPQGQYTFAELADELKTLVNAEEKDLKSSDQITVMNTTNVNGKLVITSTGSAFEPLINWDDQTTYEFWSLLGYRPQSGDAWTPTGGQAGTWYKLAGVDNGDGTFTTSMVCIPALNGLVTAYLHSELFRANMARPAAFSDCIALCVEAAYGVYDHTQLDENQTLVLYSQPIEFSRISFSLRDKNGKPIDLQGQTLRVTVRLYRKKS